MSLNSREYFVYIVTNVKRKVLYTGVTNNLPQRLVEHFLQRGNPVSFTGKYQAYYLLYYESSSYITNMILREKEIKGWRRSKKEALINSFNPEWKFLNEEVCGKWPPDRLFHRGDG